MAVRDSCSVDEGRWSRGIFGGIKICRLNLCVWGGGYVVGGGGDSQGEPQA